MDVEKIPHRFVDGISFSVFSTEELLRQGVLEVTCAETFDIVGHPTKGGLHDALLGALVFITAKQQAAYYKRICGRARHVCGNELEQRPPGEETALHARGET
ncbi:hypothetical protein HPB51_016330 [Rhipicephalus microplus]|uniref:DNA-directed RNA polymerase n=1 Tax=Rhipicephalus microplus TaxID=6941 RepID=A0A9J6ENM3_RHIMP|nr:hypothetical protein HPB51_016330 [Rhipicephalus microplus]